MKRSLKEIFQDLQRCSINYGAYQEDVAILAADITTAETFVAGIVTRILDGSPVPEDCKPSLIKDWLRNKHEWVTADGTVHDLRPYPELLKYAQVVDEARQYCRQDQGW